MDDLPQFEDDLPELEDVPEEDKFFQLDPIGGSTVVFAIFRRQTTLEVRLSRNTDRINDYNYENDESGYGVQRGYPSTEARGPAVEPVDLPG